MLGRGGLASRFGLPDPFLAVSTSRSPERAPAPRIHHKNEVIADT